MNERASIAAAAARRWSGRRSTFSRRACFCSWVGKCMRGVARPKALLSTNPRSGYPSRQKRPAPLGVVYLRRAPLSNPRRFHMSRTTKAAALALACALTAVTAYAQEATLTKIRAAKSITIGHRDASIPFSYYDDQQKPVGYAMDLCMKIVDAVKEELKMPNLDVKYQLVTSANRIPLMPNGTSDLECGSTPHNPHRQKPAARTLTNALS